ncbi:MAG: hypothetical protein EZS28_008018 [Streblomastix strix]|uniref:Uncharacterized protein n=1 Tax=Streblomastix strix TaxID=222440 RepID=A0A5J4WN08_9EUKA|nr:MAG: hypothetical protein EZS28_008018 [Streblomastix strix]
MNLPPDAHPIVFNPAILKQTPLYGQGGHVDHLYLSQLAKGYTDNECGYAISMHMSSIRCLAFHPHLMLLLSGSEDGSVALTDVSHASKRNQNQNLQPEANPLPNQSVLVENVSPYALRDKQIPMKMLDPKWLILNSYFNPLRRRLQMNKDQQRIKCNDEKEKDIMINPEYDVEDQDQQIQQQQLNHTNLISYNPIHCVQFLPYLESNNDRNRKKIQNNIGKLQKENPQVLKMSQDLGCFATGCSDGKISVYGLPDPKMQMIDNNNKFQPNKMFDIIGHKDAVFSIDETQQQSGLYRGVGIPRKGQVNNETRLVSGSADGTVRVWKIKSDGTIPITAQTSGSKDIEHNSFYLQERVFRHTPSISNSVVATWNNERQKIIRNENMNYDKNEIQFLSEREVLEDKWQESDIPSSVIFDPMNMNNVIAGYVSGDIVRFDIETNQESGFSRIGSQNKVERILTISKSRIAPHYSKGLMVPLLVTTNLGYLHLIEPNTLHTMISIKAPSEQNGNSQSNNNFIKSNFIQNKPSNENQTQTYSQQVYYSSLNDRIATLQRRNVQIGSSHIKQKIIEPSPLEMWKYDIKAQLTVRNIFTNATYLQSDSLIAASTNTGQVIMYDIRYNGYMEFGRIRDVNNRNMSSSISQQGLMNIVAHPQHNLLVTGNGDGFIKIYNSNQF